MFRTMGALVVWGCLVSIAGESACAQDSLTSAEVAPAKSKTAIPPGSTLFTLAGGLSAILEEGGPGGSWGVVGEVLGFPGSTAGLGVSAGFLNLGTRERMRLPFIMPLTGAPDPGGTSEGGTYADVKWSAVPITAQIAIGFPAPSSVFPYLGAGMGPYLLRNEIVDREDLTAWKVGFNLGGGVKTPARDDLALGIDVKWRRVIMEPEALDMLTVFGTVSFLYRPDSS